MEDVIRRRVIGTTFKPIRWTLKDGGGTPEDLSALTPGTAITGRFQEIDRDDQLIGAPLAAVGTFTFDTETFNAQNDVRDADDQIELGPHEFRTGNAVVYSDGGGTTIVGLVDGVTYYIHRVDACTVTLHPTKQDAIAEINTLAITPGLDQTHRLTSTGDNGVVLYPLDATEVATLRDLQALVQVDFGGAALEKYPTGYRYILRIVPEFAQAD